MSKRKSRLAARKPAGSMSRLAADLSKYGTQDRQQLREARNVSDLMRAGKAVRKELEVSERQLVSGDEAVPADRQHVKPCGDCPWARKALPGWLGSRTADQWLRSAHGEDVIYCHTLLGQQCAGSATYRANVCKLPRDTEALRLPPDKVRVFASPAEFKAHHEDVGGGE